MVQENSILLLANVAVVIGVVVLVMVLGIYVNVLGVS